MVVMFARILKMMSFATSILVSGLVTGNAFAGYCSSSSAFT
jgi:hypothetical protein